MDKFRAIDYFLRVADSGSLASAAQLLEVSPSAVSKAIASFEARLGFQLFYRSTRRLSLTANGAAYLERCRTIIRELERAELEGLENATRPSGTIKVGMHPAFRLPFYARIANFFTKYPNVRIVTRITNAPTILVDEGFDLLIRAGELPDSNLIARRLGRVDHVLAASPTYLARYGTPKSPKELSNHRWAVPARFDDGSTPHFEFCKGAQRYSVTVPAYITSTDGAGLPESVIGGVGIACLYSISLMDAIADGRVKPLMKSWTVPGRPVYAVFPNARAITPKTRALVKFFSSIIESGRRFAPPSICDGLSNLDRTRFRASEG